MAYSFLGAVGHSCWMKDGRFGARQLPSAMAPKPEFGACGNVGLEGTDITLLYSVLRNRLRIVAKKAKSDSIATATGFVNAVVKHRIVIATGKILGAI